MSESAIVRCPSGGYWLVNDEGERDWYATVEEALRHASPYTLVDV